MEKLDRKRAMALKATVQVGKNGITESIKKETLDQLKKNGMVKVKFNLPESGIDDFTKSIGKQAVLVMKTGRTLVFKKLEK